MARAIKGRLLREAAGRFLGGLLLFGLAGLLFMGIAWLLVPVANWLDKGGCVGNLSLGGYCIVDSILMTLGASLGLTVAVAYMVTLGKFVFSIFGRVIYVITMDESELVAEAAALDARRGR